MKTSCIATIALASIAVSARASAKGCTEVSDIVGIERCKRFGAGWSRENDVPLHLEAALVREQIAPAAHDMTASYDGRTTSQHDFTGADLGPSAGAYGADFRALAYVYRGLYLGPDWMFVAGHAASHPVSSDGYAIDRDSGLNLFAGHLGWVSGVRFALPEATSLRLEGVFGGEMILALYQVKNAAGVQQSAGAARVELFLETRAILDLWTTPWTTVSLWAGTKPFHADEVSAGLAVGIHGRPYDGRY